MKLNISENLRELRNARGITQEEVASYLGITPQSISKWERNEGYPDITMLPKIAGYFGVTVDALLGTDIVSKEEKITYFRKEYERLNRIGDARCVEIAEEGYAIYPYDWGIIEIYLRTRAWYGEPYAHIAELRSLSQLVMEKCTDANIRKCTIYAMLHVEDQEHIERWFSEVPGTYDFTEGEVCEEYYLNSCNTKKYIRQKQENRIELFEYLNNKLGLEHENASPADRISVEKKRLQLLNILFSEKDQSLFISHTIASYLTIAQVKLELDKANEAADTLKTLWELYLDAENSIGESDYGVSIFLSTPLFETISKKWVDRKDWLKNRIRTFGKNESLQNSTCFKTWINKIDD